jgi:hypothetical protein
MARINLFKSLALLVAALISLAAATPALAVVPNPVRYTFHVSPSARLLDAIGEPNFMMVMKDESWDNAMLRVQARNKPAIMITNDANSAAPITSFQLTINDGPYLFGTGDVLGDNFDNFIRQTIYSEADITGSSVSNGGKTLNVNFSGLDAGDKVIFNVDLDTSDATAFPFPDFRLVLCGAPSNPLDPVGMAATISATFTSPTPAPNTRTLTAQLAADPNVPQFFEQFVRPAKAMEMLEIKMATVPEPASALLAFASIAGLAATRRGRRNA